MKYTYLFTQISREENSNMVPVTDKPHEFVFTFGKKIETFLGESSDNTVLLTKDMWKEHPATNKEILPTVCFSTPSQQGFRRPLVMSKEADGRAGVYKYEFVYGNEIKDGSYLSDDIRTLTEMFVNGVRAVNNDAMPKSWDILADANVKRLMSYIKSEVYKQLLQDRDNIGKKRSEGYLKNVLEIFFSLIPDSIIRKFDEGLEAHDEIREKLEGIPEDDTATIKAVLKSQGYFKTFEDYKLFVVLRRYILSVKNRFNHLVWVMYRSKIGMVSLKNVKTQLSAIFGFVSKIQDDCRPKNKKQILENMCSGDLYHKAVGDFLNIIQKRFPVKDMNKSMQAALCYKFQEECHHQYLHSRFYYEDEIAKEKQKAKGKEVKDKDIYRSRNQGRFRDLCLQYWGIEDKNTLKRNKCEHLMDKFSEGTKDFEIWEPMRKKPELPK